MNKKKRENIKRLGTKLLTEKSVTVRTFAKFIGCCVATFPATEHGQLHYRDMERYKTVCLIKNRQNWNGKITLNVDSKTDIIWWIKNIKTEKFTKSLTQIQPKLSLFTDASKSGWGASINNTEEGVKGRFSEKEVAKSINSKELLAVLYAMLSLRDRLRNREITILTDNKTALSCLIKRGTQDKFRDIITKKIYKLAHKENIKFICTFVSGKSNFWADARSRDYRNPRVEWSLSEKTMNFIKMKGYTFDVDLMASFFKL